ncbi:hypothetical protein BDW67DRAFT_150853 [Aspergillus spinulosporus]
MVGKARQAAHVSVVGHHHNLTSPRSSLTPNDGLIRDRSGVGRTRIPHSSILVLWSPLLHAG